MTIPSKTTATNIFADANWEEIAKNVKPVPTFAEEIKKARARIEKLNEDRRKEEMPIPCNDDRMPLYINDNVPRGKVFVANPADYGVLNRGFEPQRAERKRAIDLTIANSFSELKKASDHETKPAVTEPTTFYDRYSRWRDDCLYRKNSR